MQCFVVYDGTAFVDYKRYSSCPATFCSARFDTVGVHHGAACTVKFARSNPCRTVDNNVPINPGLKILCRDLRLPLWSSQVYQHINTAEDESNR